MSKPKIFIYPSHDNHFKVVHDFLLDREVEPNQLWLSVGYFTHGVGRHASFKPWKNREQLDRLLCATGRKKAT